MLKNKEKENLFFKFLNNSKKSANTKKYEFLRSLLIKKNRIVKK